MQIGQRVSGYESFSSKLERFRLALANLAERGVRVAPDSRLRKYEALVAHLVDDPRLEVEELVVSAAAYAMREMDEVAEIVEHLPDVLDAATRSLLARLHKGTGSPDGESGSAAREAQYELYIGTVARRAGFEAVHGKPDLTVWDGDSRYSIEAKRPSSEARLDERVRHAVTQLKRATGGRIIALSFDEIVREPRSLLSVPRAETLAPVVAGLVREVLARQTVALQRRLQDSKVDALFITARVPGRLESSGHTALGAAQHIEALAGMQTETVRFLQRLSGAYMAIEAADSEK